MALVVQDEGGSACSAWSPCKGDVGMVSGSSRAAVGAVRFGTWL